MRKGLVVMTLTFLILIASAEQYFETLEHFQKNSRAFPKRQKQSYNNSKRNPSPYKKFKVLNKQIDKPSVLPSIILDSDRSSSFENYRNPAVFQKNQHGHLHNYNNFGGAYFNTHIPQVQTNNQDPHEYYQSAHRNGGHLKQSYPLDNFKIRNDDDRYYYETIEHSEESQMTTEISTITSTTTLEPFDVTDIKVPISFLRIEYQISFCFLGVLYGLGFLVLFQSIIVPTAKLATWIVGKILIKNKKIRPFTIQQALEQLPPN